MRKNKETDLLHGSLWDKILLFALPIAASSILQQLFNSADVIVVGQFAGKDALAAVGANGPVINLMVNLFVGLSVGANVIISRSIGQNDPDRTSRAVHTALVVALLGGLFLAVVGQFLAAPILRLISTPDDILHLAVLYLKIIFVGMPFMMIYNFSSAILRSKGDTRRPLIVLALSGVINVLLNLFFVCVCGMSVEGVAIATITSNAVSSIVLVRILMKETGAVRLEPKKLRIDGPSFGAIARIGIPAGLQGMVFSISNVIIQSAINGLGEDCMAGSAAALNLEYIVYFVINAFGQANITFLGQNYGAGNLKRCRDTTRLSLAMCMAATLLMSLLMVSLREPLSRIFNTDSAVIEFSCQRIKLVISLEVINMFNELFSGAMRGYGYSLAPALICAIGVCGVRAIWVYTVFAANPTFPRLMRVFPVSWSITAAGIITTYFIIRGKVKKQFEEKAPA